MTNQPQKEHIAILGGGIAALSAAFMLTQADDWQDKYDITLYSLGWRLGGKGATGRDATQHDRILEHGLHIWFGCYANAFRLMWEVYEALDRPPDAPLATVEEAFDPQNFAVYTEYINDEWLLWPFDFPTNPEFPGKPSDPDDPDSSLKHLTAWDYLVELLQLVERRFEAHFLPDEALSAARPRFQPPVWWGDLVTWLEADADHLLGRGEAAFIQVARQLVDHLGRNVARHTAHDHNILHWLLKEFRRWLHNKIQHLLDTHTDIRRAWILLDFGLTAAIGMLVDGVLTHGFNPLDEYDLCQWFKRHGASQYVLDSAIMRAIYDSFFAYQHGDLDQPDFAAGSALASSMELIFNYKGSVMWKMRAGTGDTVMAPLYQVLKRRGVQFKFFRRVTRLAVNSDGTAVQRVHMQRQVDVKDERGYEPLIELNGLPVWPAHPLYEQLVQGEQLKTSGANLESRWADWQPVGEETLEYGRDYTKLILGISYGALPALCQELVAANTTWQTALTSLETVITQAVQLWFKPDREGLGWTLPPPMLSGYAERYSSWADFSQLIPWENWGDLPDDQQPHAVYYASDVLRDNDQGMLPPPSAHEYPVLQAGRVKGAALDFLQHNSHLLWPDASNGDGQLDWSQLVDTDDTNGPARFNAQYWRANIDPSERYVLSPSGTNNNRINPVDTGFENFYCVGTWTYNWWYNLACMEVAVTSGMQVSRAIGGYPKQIAGDRG